MQHQTASGLDSSEGARGQNFCQVSVEARQRKYFYSGAVAVTFLVISKLVVSALFELELVLEPPQPNGLPINYLNPGKDTWGHTLHLLCPRVPLGQIQNPEKLSLKLTQNLSKLLLSLFSVVYEPGRQVTLLGLSCLLEYG